MNALDDLVLEPGAFYIMDRGYIDFARLYTFTQEMAFFIICGKRNLDFAGQAFRENPCFPVSCEPESPKRRYPEL